MARTPPTMTMMEESRHWMKWVFAGVAKMRQSFSVCMNIRKPTRKSLVAVMFVFSLIGTASLAIGLDRWEELAVAPWHIWKKSWSSTRRLHCAWRYQRGTNQSSYFYWLCLGAKSLHQHHSYSNHSWKAQEIDGVASSAREGMRGIQRETTSSPVFHSRRRPQQEKSTWSKGTFKFTLAFVTYSTNMRSLSMEWMNLVNKCLSLAPSSSSKIQESGIWPLRGSPVLERIDLLTLNNRVTVN